MKTLFLAIVLFFFTVPVYSQEMPYIENEDLFNSAVVEMSNGSFEFDIEHIFNSFINLFTEEIKANTHYLILFFITGAISAIVNLLEFKDKEISNVSFFACFTLCAGIALQLFSNILEYGVSVIDAMSDFITKLAPILTGLLLTSGKTVSAGVFHPVLASAVFIVTLIVKKCIIPLTVYASVMNIANNINEHIQISNFCKLISSVSKWILTAAFTLFTGICGIYGFSAPALDVLGAKTAKFAVGSLVPVVGRFLSDTLETVVSGSRLMKNTVGSAGLFALISICAVPVIKITVMLFTLRIASAFIEPITDKRIAKLLTDTSDIITIIFGMVVTVCVLFIICISIILAATN